jgi:hypothetical protein
MAVQKLQDLLKKNTVDQKLLALPKKNMAQEKSAKSLSHSSIPNTFSGAWWFSTAATTWPIFTPSAMMPGTFMTTKMSAGSETGAKLSKIVSKDDINQFWFFMKNKKSLSTF